MINTITQLLLMYFGVLLLLARVSWACAQSCPATRIHRTNDNRHAAPLRSNRS